MRTAAVVLLVLLAGCSRKPVEFPRAKPAAPAPNIAGQIALPGGDGKVYVIKSPDPLGLEVGTCLLHVPASGPSSMACMPPRIEVPVTAR